MPNCISIFTIMPKNIYRISVVIICILLFVYVALRAHLLSLTCDESSTLNVLGAANALDIWYKPEWFGNANNHVLNSALIRFSVQMFGWHELAIRLPNVLAYALYLWGCVRICNHVSSNNWFRLLALIFLNASNFFLDFFSVGRGYGLASGLAMGALAIYFTISNRYKMLYTYVLLSLAILANFIYLNYFIAFVIFINLWHLYKLNTQNESWSVKSLVRIYVMPLFFAIAVAIIIFTPIKMLMQTQEFKIGTSTLWASLEGYADHILYTYSNRPIGHTDKMHIVESFILGGPLMGIYFLLKQRKVTPFHPALAVLMAAIVIFSSLVFISFVQRHLLGTMYLDERKAIIFTPLISLILVCLAAFILGKNLLFSKVFFVLIVVMYVANFIANINLKYCREWWYDAGSKQTVAMANSMAKANATILVDWRFYWSVYMYNKHFYKNTFKHIATSRELDAADTTMDYCYFTGADLNKVHPLYTPIYRATYDGFLFEKNYKNYDSAKMYLQTLPSNVNKNADSLLLQLRVSADWNKWLPKN
jgi:hypothetical protein